MATVRLEVLIILHRKKANTRGSRQYIRMTLLEISIIKNQLLKKPALNLISIKIDLLIIKNSSSMVLRRLSIGIMEETVV